MVKIAMVGAGGYAYLLIKLIWTIPEKCQLVAVTSNPERKSPGAAACREKGIKVYPTLEELLKNLQVCCDVIFVPTPIQQILIITL